MKKRQNIPFGQSYAKKLEGWKCYALLLLLAGLGWGRGLAQEPVPCRSHPGLGLPATVSAGELTRASRPVPDSVIERELWPIVQPLLRERFRYGLGEGLAERLVDNWQGQPPHWQAVARETFDLRPDGQASVARTFIPSSSGWFLQRVDSLDYGADGGLQQRRAYRYGSPGAAATPYERERYERDGQGRILHYFRDLWQADWQPWIRIAYSYGSEAFPLRSRTAFWEVDSGAYRLAGGADFVLSQGRVDTASYALVDSQGQWVPDYRDLYQYANEGQEVWLQRERWQATGWEAEERRRWVYDQRQELVSQVVSLPDSLGWQPYRRYERVLRAEPLTRYRLGFWTGSAWGWERDVTTHYPRLTSAGQATLAWRMFPNPAGEVVFLAGLPTGPLQYQLCDAQGRVVRAGQLQGPAHRLSLAGLAEGGYWLRIQGVGKGGSQLLWRQL